MEQLQFFFNTTDISGPELETEIKVAKTQEEIIYKIYQKQNKKMTVSDVLFKLQEQKHNFIKVSVGRAITQLYKKDKLVKLEERKMSIHNKAEHFYILKS